jgi:uncharacterized protein (TIGR02246 family)
MAAKSPAELLAAFLAAVNARDLDTAVELWREDAAIVQLDGEVLRGRDAIAGALQAMIDNHIEIDTEVSGIVEAGDVALVTGTLTLSGANGDGTDERFSTRSSSTVIYKRDAEGWRIALDAPWGLSAPPQ